MKNIYSIITVLVFTFGVNTFAQSRTNLEELLKLIDAGTSKISREIGGGIKYRINFISPSEYRFLKNRTIKGFKERTDSAADYSLNVILIKAQTAYKDVFRDGFLGSFKVERKFDLKLDFTLERAGRIIKSGDISESATDTTDYDKVKNLEMMSLPFTRSELPPEPFFSGLLEPAVAIGSAAVAIYLLFAVRSK